MLFIYTTAATRNLFSIKIMVLSKILKQIKTIVSINPTYTEHIQTYNQKTACTNIIYSVCILLVGLYELYERTQLLI